MIVRTWHGCVPLQHAEGFARHLERTGVEHAQSIAGNRGRWCARKTRANGRISFLPPTGRISRRSKPSLAKTITSRLTYPDDEAFELLSDPYVFQHEVEAVSPL